MLISVLFGSTAKMVKLEAGQEKLAVKLAIGAGKSV
jgi:hypothetical protein